MIKPPSIGYYTIHLKKQGKNKRSLAKCIPLTKPATQYYQTRPLILIKTGPPLYEICYPCLSKKDKEAKSEQTDV